MGWSADVELKASADEPCGRKVYEEKRRVYVWKMLPRHPSLERWLGMKKSSGRLTFRGPDAMMKHGLAPLFPLRRQALPGELTIVEEAAMSEEIIQGSDANFEADVLKSALPVLVDFWAPWCGPCQMIAPILEEIAQARKGTLKVVKINVDENGKTPITYGVMAIPTLLLFKGGELKEKVVGVLPRTKIDELLTKHL